MFFTNNMFPVMSDLDGEQKNLNTSLLNFELRMSFKCHIESKVRLQDLNLIQNN